MHGRPYPPNLWRAVDEQGEFLLPTPSVRSIVRATALSSEDYHTTGRSANVSLDPSAPPAGPLVLVVRPLVQVTFDSVPDGAAKIAIVDELGLRREHRCRRGRQPAVVPEPHVALAVDASGHSLRQTSFEVGAEGLHLALPLGRTLRGRNGRGRCLARSGSHASTRRPGTRRDLARRRRAAPKHHPRIAAYGTLDELSDMLGLCRERDPGGLGKLLRSIQNDLFDAGSTCACRVLRREAADPACVHGTHGARDRSAGTRASSRGSSRAPGRSAASGLASPRAHGLPARGEVT